MATRTSLNHYFDPAAFAFDPAAFAVRAVNTLGNSKARVVEGPWYWQLNLALARVLDLGRATTLERRARRVRFHSRRFVVRLTR